MRDNVEGVINPFDKNAIEEALRIKDQLGGEVILLSMGPDGYMSSLRDGLAMGADRAILLSSWAFGGADTLATGYPISQAIKKNWWRGFGVSRPLTDHAEFGHESQIGQSGQSIAPDLLINFGISGATQYLVGIEKEK